MVLASPEYKKKKSPAGILTEGALFLGITYQKLLDKICLLLITVLYIQYTKEGCSRLAIGWGHDNTKKSTFYPRVYQPEGLFPSGLAKDHSWISLAQ